MEASAKFGFFRGEGEEQTEKGVMVVEKEKHASDSSLSLSLSLSFVGLNSTADPGKNMCSNQE